MATVNTIEYFSVATIECDIFCLFVCFLCIIVWNIKWVYSIFQMHTSSSCWMQWSLLAGNFTSCCHGSALLIQYFNIIFHCVLYKTFKALPPGFSISYIFRVGVLTFPYIFLILYVVNRWPSHVHLHQFNFLHALLLCLVLCCKLIVFVLKLVNKLSYKESKWRLLSNSWFLFLFLFKANEKYYSYLLQVWDPLSIMFLGDNNHIFMLTSVIQFNKSLSLYADYFKWVTSGADDTFSPVCCVFW